MLLLLIGSNAAITAVLDVTDGPDLVAFAGDFPVFAVFAVLDASDTVSMSGVVDNVGWVAVVKQSETWTTAIMQTETWTPAVKQAETWTPR